MTPMCDNCHARPAWQQWGGEQFCGVCSARSSRNLPWWCERCIVEAQIAYLQKLAYQLPERKRRLAQLTEEPR
jgi:hypothetical protein